MQIRFCSEVSSENRWEMKFQHWNTGVQEWFLADKLFPAWEEADFHAQKWHKMRNSLPQPGK